MPSNPYYSSLKFNVNGEDYIGVGWFQRSFSSSPISLVIKPKGQQGIFRLRCGSDLITKVEYTTSPFLVPIPVGASCDFSMAATNEDVPDIEYATFSYKEQGYTKSLTAPRVSTKKGVITFSFEDDVNAKAKPVVYGVSVNGTTCEAKYKCSLSSNSDFYEVRAVTMGGRFFYGVYNKQSNSWGGIL